MRIGGIQRASLIDYPGEIGAVIFTIGCNFRCPYCHNRELVEETASELDTEKVLSLLENRRRVLDAVTITGGEPTLHDDLPLFIGRLKTLGYKIKLDTNGTHPRMLEELLRRKLIDYIAMDLKAPLNEYSRVAARTVSHQSLCLSIGLIMHSGLPYEFRTTIVRTLLSPEDIESIACDIEGARRYCLQKFIPTNILNPAFIKKTTYSDREFEAIKERVSPYVQECIIR